MMNDERPLAAARDEPPRAASHTPLAHEAKAQPGGIKVHIGELVLQGFPPNDRYRIGEAMERELARLLTEENLPPSWHQENVVDNLNAGEFRLTPGAKPEAVGKQIAQAVYRELSR